MSNKAIFLDRDDTLIEDPGYINDPNQVEVIDGVPESLIELKKMGYKLVVVSNQSGVARGIVTEKVLGEIHSRLKELLAREGAVLDKIYYCPYHPNGAVRKYRKNSNLRKPSPGMILKACEEMNIDIGRSWMIGDGSIDIEAGLKAGCKTILLDNSSKDKGFELENVKPDYRAVNMKEAVNIVKKQNGFIKDTAKQDIKKQTKQAEPMSKVEPVSAFDSGEEKKESHNISGQTTEQLLERILEQLKSMQRTVMFDEFSIMRLLAGIVQVAAVFCLLLCIWFLLSPEKEYNSTFISLGFAIVFQMMALTFYIMQGRK